MESTLSLAKPTGSPFRNATNPMGNLFLLHASCKSSWASCCWLGPYHCGHSASNHFARTGTNSGESAKNAIWNSPRRPFTLLHLTCQRFRFFHRFLDRAYHIEGILGKV